MENIDESGEAENKTEALRCEVSELEARVSALSDAVNRVGDRLENMLLKQIEVLSVFVAVISLVITNLVGIDALGSIGLRGLAKIDAVFVLSAFVLLLAVKLIIIGFRKK